MTVTKGKNTSLSLAGSGGVTIGGGTSHAKSKAQLMLALEESIQPPKEPPAELAFIFTGLVIAAFVSLALMAATGLQSGSWFFFFFTPSSLVLGVLFGLVALKAQDEYRESVRMYNTKWICLRCGHTWYVRD
ncbi:MAG: hypothetical protein WCF57_09400 [Pyrinomonadaceae bacterium]